MSHVMFGGLTHEPGDRPRPRLLDRAHARPLDHVFFADSGSVSVEVAIKMARAVPARHAAAPASTRMLALRGGYHGDTFGAMSVCDPVGGMHQMFTDVLPPSRSSRPAPRPVSTPTPTPGSPRPQAVVDALDARRARRRHLSSRCCRVPAGCRSTARAPARGSASCRRTRGWLLILDEIATGFGRTGELFARRPRRHQPRHHVRRQGADRRLPHARRHLVHARCRRRHRRQ